MLGSFVFFIVARNLVGEKYRLSLVISAVVVGIAGYHYFRIFESWNAAFILEGGKYLPSGQPFNNAYRYIDWMITVPLLLVELVTVLALTREKSASLLARLTIAAFLMIVLGYPGEISRDTELFSNRGLWGTLSTIPFAYILYVLWVELGKAIENQSARVKILVRNIRLLTLATWGFYPIAYMAPFFNLSGAGSEVFLQVGYSIADILAKCGYGVMIYAIAKEKTLQD
ncbi:MAG: bacteriorhodopsin-like, partial [Ignavibacterium sp.]|uniref:bacteriorhodopsin-like n=1 Tax=Ignavibacterium sp. TaxID=2651167 RepID=UPI004049647A